MMFRALAITALALSAADPSVAAEQESRSPEVPAAQEQAEQRAREAVAQRLKIATEDIAVTQVEARTWSDSSMGCAKPGTAALTVITEGYAVSLQAQGRDYRVHVSGNNVAVCDKAVALRRETPAAPRARGLDVMIERARQDLAQRLGVDAATIRIAGMTPRRWTESTSGCEIPQAASSAQPVDGFDLALRHSGRIYTYRTDRQHVSACPAIEPE
jgi:hypothetical protein